MTAGSPIGTDCDWPAWLAYGLFYVAVVSLVVGVPIGLGSCCFAGCCLETASQPRHAKPKWCGWTSSAFPVPASSKSPCVAFATPDVDFLCFGESDQPSPASAHAAAVAALDAGITRYPDVRGLPELRAALAEYLTELHARPVSEQRIQITASGMTAVSVALAATVRAGDRVVLHSPSWPNVGNAARLRGAQVDELDLTALPEGGFRLDFDRLDAMLQGARAFILNSPNNPTGWTATRDELAAILEITRRRRVWLIADEVYSRLVYDGAAAAPSILDIADRTTGSWSATASPRPG